MYLYGHIQCHLTKRLWVRLLAELNRFAKSFYITVGNAYVQGPGHGGTDCDLAAGCRNAEGAVPSSSSQSRMFELLVDRTGRTDLLPCAASLRHPGDLANSSQQVLRQCMSLNGTMDLGQVSSHCPVRIGSIAVIYRTATSLERFTGRFVPTSGS